MGIDTKLIGAPKRHLFLPASGGRATAAYSQVHLVGWKLSKEWGDIERILNGEQKILAKVAVTTWKKLSALYDYISQFTSRYELHPTLVLSQHLQDIFALQEFIPIGKADKKVLLETLNEYMATLSYCLDGTAHRATRANFDRLSRRKKNSVRQWLNHQVRSQKSRILNVTFYSSSSIKNDISQEEISTAVAHLIRGMSNKRSASRQYNGHVWQLVYDNGVGYYVDWLLAIPSDTNKKTLIDLFYATWVESWKVVKNPPQNIPRPFVVQDRDVVLSNENIDDSIDSMIDCFCSLDGVMKLKLPATVKSYSMSRIRK